MSASTASSEIHAVFPCDGCGLSFGRGDLLRCSGCKMVSYHSAECQKADWASHKIECKKMRKLRKRKASSGKISYLQRDERARQFCFRQKWAEAENEFRLMIAEDATDSGVWGNLGRVLEAQGDVDGAVRCLKKATYLRPDLADRHYNLGVTLQNCGKLAEAVNSYDKCLDIDPTFYDAATNRDIARNLMAPMKMMPSGVTVETTQSDGVCVTSFTAPASNR